MNVDAIVEELSRLPAGMLYLIMAAVSALENVFPPFPSDVVVGFGSFLAARGQASVVAAFLACWLGNIGGASFTYYIGRRYGAGTFLHRLEKYAGKRAEPKLRSLYDKYGILALFVSRFLPGVRALVPPFAGAMRLPPWRTAIAVAAASGIWFAFITWLAFQAGENWELLYHRMVKSSKIAGLIAFGLVLIGIAAWLIWRKKKNDINPEENG